MYSIHTLGGFPPTRPVPERREVCFYFSPPKFIKDRLIRPNLKNTTLELPKLNCKLGANIWGAINFNDVS
jgi:hypothetical protein